MITFSGHETRSAKPARLEARRFTGNLLLTGGDSELGDMLARRLHDAGVSVAVQCSSSRYRKDGVRTFPMPLLDPELRDRISELKPDVVLHCHGDSSGMNRTLKAYESYSVTMDRVVALCDVLHSSSPGSRLVMLSPDSAKREEIPYARFAGLSESLLGECAESFGLETTVLQTGQIFSAGLRSHAVYDLLFRLHAPGKDSVPLPYRQDEELDLLHVSDLAATLSEILGQTLSPALRLHGNRISAGELAEALSRITECRRPYSFLSEVSKYRGTPAQPASCIAVECRKEAPLFEALRAFATWWLGSTRP